MPDAEALIAIVVLCGAAVILTVRSLELRDSLARCKAHENTLVNENAALRRALEGAQAVQGALIDVLQGRAAEDEDEP